MKRRNRASLKQRALNSAQGYERPAHVLNAEEALFRVTHAWLQGYDAARRDSQEDRAAYAVDSFNLRYRIERQRFEIDELMTYVKDLERRVASSNKGLP